MFALLLVASLWSGANAPPPGMPDSLITRTLPAREKQLVTSRRHMIASAHPLASEAGRKILIAKGSVADAALCVQAVLAVVEPENSGPGGGCFILYHDMATGRLVAIDGREELPLGGSPRMFLDEEGRVLPEALSGGLPVGVPGTIAAMSKLHRDFGKLPLAAVLAPAIELAERGVAVSPDLARALRSQGPRLRRFPSSRELYFHPDGRPLAEGDTLANPGLARFLRLWADDPSGRFFYRGPVAEAVVAIVANNPFRAGTLSAADLLGYQAVYREPIVGEYRGFGIGVMPPPTSGGITLLEILGILATRPTPEGSLRSPATLIEHLDRLARASRLAFADRGRYLGDPDWNPDIPMHALFDPAYLDERALAAFAAGGSLDFPAEEGAIEGYDTTHFSIIGEDGSTLACTSTIEYTFGSAMVVPGYGFLLNNELTDFNLVPSDPPLPNDIESGRRLRSGALDADPGEGGKRPRSSMCPVIVYDDDGKPILALGSPGGSRIIGTVASVLINLLDYEMNLSEALNFPRLHCRNRPLEIETWGWTRDVVADSMRARGWEIAPLRSYPLLQGDVHAVSVYERNQRRGASDSRHDGGVSGG
jgi:gamma-glutamyltranspeptidase/glutathione hydrolase